MSEGLRDLSSSTKPSEVGPDCFAFYTREVEELISSDQDFLPFSSEAAEPVGRTYGVVGEKDVIRHNLDGKNTTLLGSLFCDGIGAGFSDFKKEKLKSLLQQTVVSLSQEVDEMLDPVLAIRRIQSQLRSRWSLTNHSAVACEGDEEQLPRKKSRLSSSSSSGSYNEGNDADLPENVSINGANKICALCHATKTPMWRTGRKGQKLCNACGLKFEKETVPLSGKNQNTESCLVSSTQANNEVKEVNTDLQFLLGNSCLKVESSMKKHSDELSVTLGHMEQQLEGLLDKVLSSCRLMNLTEKQQLQKLIQKLPPPNLDRVVEIIQRHKPLGNYYSEEIHVDLEEEDNVTLWRLYFYVEAVQNARKLSS